MAQEITIRGSNKVFRVMDDVYPYGEGGILYIRMITVNEEGEPEKFLCLQPQDILTREMPYSQEFMRDVREAGKAADAQQQEYMLAAEEEMKAKAEALKENEETGEPIVHEGLYG